MQDPPLTEPERDVVRPLARPEEDEVARTQVALLQSLGRGFLLVRVSRHEPAQATVRHVHEAGAVDPTLGHTAPLVRSSEVGAGLGRLVAGTRQAGPLAVRLA